MCDQDKKKTGFGNDAVRLHEAGQDTVPVSANLLVLDDSFGKHNIYGVGSSR